jgi:hypothetical protein
VGAGLGIPLSYDIGSARAADSGKKEALLAGAILKEIIGRKHGSPAFGLRKNKSEPSEKVRI